MKTEVREARLEDCQFLADVMDDAGREFISRYWDIDAAAGLAMAFKGSTLCWSIFIDGEIAGMFGCTMAGQVWLTTAPAIDKVKLRFIRRSGPYIQEMLNKNGGHIYALAHMDNTLLLRWLEWAGFERAGRQGDFWICVCQSH